jgi:hypothetical protein
MNTIFLLIVFLPLLGAILAGVFGTALLKGTQDHAAMHTTMTTIITTTVRRGPCT